MIILSNGHKFSIACASGALSFGQGYCWEQYFLIPLGIIQPKLFTIITSSITLEPREGNLKLWPPCVWPLADGGAVNAKGLTNKGLQWLLDEYWNNRFPIKNLPTIVSIVVESPTQATEMAARLEECRTIVGLEVNVSCPNTNPIEGIIEIFRAVKKASSHPVGLKLGYHDPFVDICNVLDGEADWFDLINTIKWPQLSRKPSPLARWGFVGAVSGPRLVQYSRAALRLLGNVTGKTPILSGGGCWKRQGSNLATTKQRISRHGRNTFPDTLLAGESDCKGCHEV